MQAWEAEHGDIGEGEVVLFASGWDANYLPLPDGGIFLPLKVAHGTGAPGRAVAFVPDGARG